MPLAFRQNHIVFIGRDAVNVSILQERVRQKMETAAKKDVFLRGDRGVNLGEVMQVTDLLKAAGVEHVEADAAAGRTLVEVTDVLRDRMQEPGGLPVTALVSLLVHAAIGAALIVGPMRWLAHPVEEQQRPVMTISLGGAGTGPQAGGLTSIGARPVQTTEPAPKREAVRAPAAAVPEMTVPIAKAPPAKAAKAPAKPTEAVSPIPDATSKTLARGDELRTGSAVAETGARGKGLAFRPAAPPALARRSTSATSAARSTSCC